MRDPIGSMETRITSYGIDWRYFGDQTDATVRVVDSTRETPHIALNKELDVYVSVPMLTQIVEDAVRLYPEIAHKLRDALCADCERIEPEQLAEYLADTAESRAA